MKLVFTKIVSIAFLLAGSLPVLFALFFIIKQQAIRHMMKEKLEQQNLHTISLPGTDVHWAKPGKEIRVDGRMFDIKSFSEKNGTYTFTGLFDDDETALNEYLEKDVNQKNESSNRLLSQLFQWLQAVDPATSADNCLTIQFQNPTASFYGLIIPFAYKTILTPPPRIDYSFA